jgi:ABC-type transporter Mla maintaining outer membrane lipid asymmetry permease subunit MlaE
MASSGIKGVFSDLQDFYNLSFRGLPGVGRRPFYLRDVIDQMDYAGPGSLPIIILVSLFPR